MASVKDDFTGEWWDTDDHLLVRARMVRQNSIKWAPPVRDYPMLFSVLLKAPQYPGGKWLAVFKATVEAGEVVYFHKGSSLMAALANGLSVVFSGRASWKVETPYRSRTG